MRWICPSGPIIAVACAVGAVSAMVAACGGSTPLCGMDAGTPDDASPTEDASPGDSTAPGMLQVNGTFTNTLCPSVNPIGIGPENAGTVNVSATINSAPQEGGVPVLTWTATSGTFMDPHAGDTTFFCGARGVAKITVTVTLSTGGLCSQKETGLVMCTSAAAGH